MAKITRRKGKNTDRNKLSAPSVLLRGARDAPQRFCDLEKEQVCDLFDTARKVAAVMLLKHRRNAYSITLQDGAAAGQTVHHVHLHVMPQYPGDFEDPSAQQHPPQTAAAGSGNETRLDLAERRPRLHSEMAEEAAELRELVNQLAKKYPS